MNYIKTNNKWARQRGTTLVELSVVIAVILLLVGVLFIGISAWKNSANQAACIVNLATIQKAMRGYENTNLLGDGTNGSTAGTCTIADLVTAQYFGTAPTCPASGKAYTDKGVITAPGVVFASCPSTPAHVPTNFANW